MNKKKLSTTGRSWLHPALYSWPISDEIGFGLFTSKDIPKGTLIIISGGDVYSTEEEKHLPLELRDIGHMVTPSLVFGTRLVDRMDAQDVINHSCEPNCGFKGQVFFVTMRNIVAGEQITIDYATVLCDLDGFEYSLTCRCGSPECRGKITSSDWRIPEVQHKYHGYFQWYLQDIIDNDGATITYPTVNQ